MILTIDVGNTNIVLSCIDDGKILSDGRIVTDRSLSVGQMSKKIDAFLDNIGVSESCIEKAVIASVVPSVTETVCAACKKWGVMRLSFNANHGVTLDVDYPERVGEDLIAGALGAAAIVPLPALIVDMGTATTVTAVDKDMHYLGGLILAGAKMSTDALHEKTAQLPKIDGISAPSSIFAKNTADSIAAGIVYSNAAMIDGICARMTDELGMKCSVVATGGLAELVVPFCRTEAVYDADLVPRGLWEFYRRNL